MVFENDKGQSLLEQNPLDDSGNNKIPKQLNTFGLNLKQIDWADEYFITRNQTAAYRNAYGLKGRPAENGGNRLASNPKIRMYLQEKLKKRQSRAVVTLNRIEQEFESIAFSSLYDMFEEAESGELNLKSGETLTASQKASMQQITILQHRDGSKSIKFKLYNKMDALTQLTRMKGGFNDDKTAGDGKSFDQAVKDRKMRKLAIRETNRPERLK